MIQSLFPYKEVNNLQETLAKEFLVTSEKGIYAYSTIIGCHQRKYHGLLVAPQPQIDNDDHIFLSTIDETITIQDCNYSLAMHSYPNIDQPEGYKYLKEFFGAPMPKWVFEMEKTILSKEIIVSGHEDGILVRYRLHESAEEIEMDICPLLAYRNVHYLTSSTTPLFKKINSFNNGIKIESAYGYSDLFFISSATTEFKLDPTWYYNVEYPIESWRGYAFHEDLLSPGQFRFRLKEKDTLTLYIGFKKIRSGNVEKHFFNVYRQTPELNDMQQCMVHATQQFIQKSEKKVLVKAGFPWFGLWGRDTFISLPGLTLVFGHINTFKQVIASMLPDLKEGLFAVTGAGSKAIYNSVDTSLWFIWSIQQYVLFTGQLNKVWQDYGKYMKSILRYYADGTLFNIKMDKDYLIKSGSRHTALTWMDCIIDGHPVTPRNGKPVEVNALWYNAVCFCLEAATVAEDEDFLCQWKDIPERIKKSFLEGFVQSDKNYLADCFDDDYHDWSIRPNQLIAFSLPYSPVSSTQCKAGLQVIKRELLTPRGLRTLSPSDPAYRGIYAGDQSSRDRAYHQGSVWPWLLAHFAEAWFKEYNQDGIQLIEELYNGFKSALTELCLYTIPELYNGNAPHAPVGAVSQAWSVAELNRMHNLLNHYKQLYHLSPTVSV